MWLCYAWLTSQSTISIDSYTKVRIFIGFDLLKGITRVSSGRQALRINMRNIRWLLLSPEDSSERAMESIPNEDLEESKVPQVKFSALPKAYYVFPG